MHNQLLAVSAAFHTRATAFVASTADRLRKLENDEGMSTIEYAFGSLAAAALAGVLYMVVNGNGVVSGIEGVITDALSSTPK